MVEPPTAKGVATAVPSMGYGLENIRSKIATRDHVRDCVLAPAHRFGRCPIELLPVCQFETILASEFAGGVSGDGFGYGDQELAATSCEIGSATAGLIATDAEAASRLSTIARPSRGSSANRAVGTTLYVRHRPHLITIWRSTTRRSAVDNATNSPGQPCRTHHRQGLRYHSRSATRQYGARSNRRSMPPELACRSSVALFAFALRRSPFGKEELAAYAKASISQPHELHISSETS